MRRVVITALIVAVAGAVATPVIAQQPDNSSAPVIPFVSVPGYLKYSPDMNLGEVLGVAENSKGHLAVLNHPGTATSGPLYGNATTQLLEFDDRGQFLREIGQGVYGLGYSHAIRFDKYDNLWVVDKGTNAVVKFDPSGYVTLNLGRRPEGYEPPPHTTQQDARHVDGYFDGPTDIGWDADDNIYVSDGYVNSRVAKFDKHGNWIKSWGTYGTGPGQLRLPHNMQVDRDGNVYVADRSNNRIQVFNSDGDLLRIMYLDAPYDKTRQPVLGNLNPNPPDQTAPWTLCISDGPTQYLFAADVEPGRLYKMTLDGKILGMLGESGRQLGQFNWPHGLSCRSEGIVYVADLNNWRVQKILLNHTGSSTSGQ